MPRERLIAERSDLWSHPWLVRGIALIAVFGFAGCDVFPSVGRTLRPPFAFQPKALLALAATMPEAAPSENGDSVTLWRPLDRALVFVFLQPVDLGGAIHIESAWGGTPEYADLSASIALQGEVLRRLEAGVPGFPPKSALPLEWSEWPWLWVGGGAWKELRARHEREHGT